MVQAELTRLREAATARLGALAAGAEIGQSSLLRRQVARRCVYGVDRNGIAVELARLAIWIHTFVAGLQLSFLDHSLVEGDSLTGIGTVDEALQELDPSTHELRYSARPASSCVTVSSPVSVVRTWRVRTAVTSWSKAAPTRSRRSGSTEPRITDTAP